MIFSCRHAFQRKERKNKFVVRMGLIVELLYCEATRASWDGRQSDTNRNILKKSTPKTFAKGGYAPPPRTTVTTTHNHPTFAQHIVEPWPPPPIAISPAQQLPPFQMLGRKEMQQLSTMVGYSQSYGQARFGGWTPRRHHNIAAWWNGFEYDAVVIVSHRFDCNDILSWTAFLCKNWCQRFDIHEVMDQRRVDNGISQYSMAMQI